MKRSNIVNQHSFLGSALVAGLALASSLLLLGCAADTDSDDTKGDTNVPEVVDQVSGVGAPIPIPASPAQLVGAQSATSPIPIPPARSVAPQSGANPIPIPPLQSATPQAGDDSPIPIPAFTKP